MVSNNVKEAMQQLSLQNEVVDMSNARSVVNISEFVLTAQDIQFERSGALRVTVMQCHGLISANLQRPWLRGNVTYR